MKKRVLFALLAVFAFVCPLIAETATVSYVVGKVEVNRNGQWVPVKVGDKIAESETINTGFQSEAVLKFNGSSIKVAAMTRVKVNTLSASENKVAISVNSGSVRSKVAKPQDGSRAKYTATTPVAVASVRGTDFIISARGKVACSEGRVAVWSKKKYDTKSLKKALKVAKKKGIDLGDLDIDSLDIDALVDDWTMGGDVSVEKGQSTSLTTSGEPKLPMNESSDELKRTKTYVTTAAEKDELEAGGSRAKAVTSTATLEIVIDFN